MKKAFLISLSVHTSILLLVVLVAIVKQRTSRFEIPQFVQLIPDIIEQVEKPVKPSKQPTTQRLKKTPDTSKLRAKILTRLKTMDTADSVKPVESLQPVSKEDVHISAGKFPYLWYLTVIKTKLSNAWVPPSEYIISKEGVSVTVCFTVNKNGIMSNVKIKHSSGMKLLDNSALDAVKSVGTLPALPSEWREEYLNVSIIFKTL